MTDAVLLSEIARLERVVKDLELEVHTAEVMRVEARSSLNLRVQDIKRLDADNRALRARVAELESKECP